jgi:hypothetical protein
MADDYYITRKPNLLKDFDRTAKQMRKMLGPRYGKDCAETFVRETRCEFEALIPELPYIGGRKNRLTKNLVGSAWCLALYRTFRNHDITAEETGRILCEMVRAQLNAYPKVLLCLLGRFRFSRYALAKLKRQAEESQRRRYAADWVYTVVEGDGTTFDYGVDYTECGICKFLHEQGADELIPFLCALDFPMSDAFGTGLVRTMTVAEGNEKCDFRFRKNRKAEQARPPEVPRREARWSQKARTGRLTGRNNRNSNGYLLFGGTMKLWFKTRKGNR